MDVSAQFDSYLQQAAEAIAAAASADALEQVRVEYLGAKKGRLRDLQSLLGKADKTERPQLGKRFNEVKNAVTALYDERKAALSAPEAVTTGLDITLPGAAPPLGNRHPLTQTIEEFKDIMGRFGFTVASGPEIEDEHHNFEALNIPDDHPARDPLDNFYLAAAETATGGPLLLRSQTSTVQIRVMEQTQPPIRIISLGRVYRPDTMDRTHSCMFHQMEGLMVGGVGDDGGIEDRVAVVRADLFGARRTRPFSAFLFSIHRALC